MKDCAFICGSFSLNFYTPVIRALPADFVDVILADQKSKEEKLRSQEISTLEEQGYQCYFANNNVLTKYKYIVIDLLYARGSSVISREVLYAKHNLGLTHAVDASSHIRSPIHSYLLASQKQALQEQENKVNKYQHATIFKQLQTIPRDQIMEFAYTGPYHLGEWESKRNAPKAALRRELEEYLQRSLPATRPVVAFLQDELCHPRQIAQYLSALAEHVTLIVKPLTLNLQELPSKALLWPDSGSAPNLLRFAADYILGGYHSGSLASSVMLGLKVIPYYTTLIRYRERNVKKLANYRKYLPEVGVVQQGHIATQILQYISPLDLGNMPALLDRVADASYWEAYYKKLPEIQKAIFGEYRIEGAARSTALMIMKQLAKKTFGKDTAAIYLRPEYGKIVSCAGSARAHGTGAAD